MNLEHNLDDLDQWLALTIARLSPSEQKKLLRKIGGGLRRNTAKRIRAQTSPEGEAWSERKPASGSKGGSGRPRGRRNPNPQRGNPELKFQYDGVSVHLKSYEDEGKTLLGFDLVTRSIKRYRKDRIGKAKRQHKKMMRQMHKAKNLRLRVHQESLILGWSGSAGRVARIHHFGLNEKLKYGLAQYPARELIGLTDSDKKQIRDIVIQHLESIA